ncbi:MAG TPA: hypothetical protein VFE34_11200 [Dongiaceae bacterium]|jgi:hypothetical protein|nr:hypothetical protein [Dongiaceae bacterium]
MRFILHVAAVLACLAAPGMASAASQNAGNHCPPGAAGRDFDGLLLCVPGGNERYLLTSDGVDWMAWQGDEPIPRPTKDKPAAGNELELTLARAWIGETIVGAADSASGQNGFDQFMKLIAASIMQNASTPGSDEGFAADVPVDESGILQHFEFSYLEADLLQGKRADKKAGGPGVILFRPSSGLERPHILLCGATKTDQSPVHVCMSMRDMEGHRIGIMVAGTKLARSFRVSEQVGADLESFVVRSAP